MVTDQHEENSSNWGGISGRVPLNLLIQKLSRHPAKSYALFRLLAQCGACCRHAHFVRQFSALFDERLTRPILVHRLCTLQPQAKRGAAQAELPMAVPLKPADADGDCPGSFGLSQVHLAAGNPVSTRLLFYQ